MPRVKIHLPERFPFQTEITLYLGHMNYRNHLDNAMLLSIVSEARMRFLQSMGYSEADVEGVGVILADAALQYRSEAFHGEVMVVRMGVADLASRGCDFVWSMAEKASGREVARGKSGVVFYDYEAGRVAALPDAFLRRFGDAGGCQ